MSNYLDQLVAKNLNSIDTVQPFLLSVFGFLPDSPVEMGSEESWGINPEIVMSDSGDYPMTTELETNPETQILGNSDIVQPLEWQYAKRQASGLSLATDVQSFNNDTSYPASTGLTPTPTQDSEPTATAASFLADKSDSKLSSTQPFSQPAEILPTTDRIPPTPNIQLFSSDSAYSASGQFTQKQLEAISNPSVPQTQPVTESSGQQPVEINQVFPSPAEPKVVREQLFSDRSQLQPAASSSSFTMGKVPSVLDTQPLLPALAVERPTTALNKIGMKSEPPNRQEIDFQGDRENQIVPEIGNASTTFARESDRIRFSYSTNQPTLREAAGASTTPTPLPAWERGARGGIGERGFWKPDLVSKGQQPVEIHETVSLTQPKKVVSSSQTLTQPQSESVAIERTPDRVLPILEKQTLMPATHLETNTPLSEPTVKLQGDAVPLLSRQPTIEIARLVPSSPPSKVIREELSSPRSQLKQAEIAPDRSAVLGAIETQPLTPAPTVETNTPQAHPAVEQLTQPATESKEAQSERIHPAVSRTQSQEMVSSSQTLTQPQSESVTIEPTSEPVLPILEKQTLMPAPRVETNTPLSAPTVKLQGDAVPLFSGQPAIEIARLVPSSPPSKVMREELSSHQSQLKQAEIAPDRSPVLGAIETQPLMPAPRVETNTPQAHPAVEQLTRPTTELKGQSSVRIPPAVSRTQSPKMVSRSQLLTQPQSESVAIERPPDRVPMPGLSPLPSHYQDYPPNPTPNIVRPINDDGRRSSVFGSASRQEQRRRESFGNSATPPTIQVSIGRMEIRTPPPPPPPRPKLRPNPNLMSLDEYLRQRSRGR